MPWKNCILSLVLFSVITKYEVFAGNFHRLEYNVMKHVETTVKSDNLSVVKFKNISCVVHYYNRVLEPKPDEIRSKSMQFYFCINCKFANWIQNKLLSVIEGIPLLHFPDLESSYKDEFRKRISVETIADISVKVERFLSVLFNIVNMYTYSAHIDTDLLKSLVLFYFKMNFITNTYNDNDRVDNVGTSSTNDGKDEVIIPLILESVNAFQKFYVLNCDISSWYHDKSQIFGYSTSAQDSKENIEIDKLFLDMYPMGSESHDRCTMGRILLRDILHSEEDVVGREISNVKLRLARGYVSLKAIVAEVGYSYNPELVLWYHQIVHKAIVKIVCTKMHDVLASKEKLSSNAIIAFKALNFLFSDFMNLPHGLMDIFGKLASDGPLDNAYYPKIKTAVKEYLSGLKMYDEDVYGASRLPFFHVEVAAEESVSSLEHFLHTVMNTIADYRCMVNVFKLLNVDKAKYYLPHVQRSFTVYEFLEKKFHRIALKAQPRPGEREKRTIGRGDEPGASSWHDEHDGRGRESHPQIADDPSMQADTCDYVIAVYKHCVDASATIGGGHESPAAAAPYRTELNRAVAAVTDHLRVNLFKTDRRSASFGQLVFNVAPMATVVGPGDEACLLYAEGLPYLYLVMTALNEYGITHCAPPKYRYLLYNNVEPDAADQHRCDDEREKFLAKLGQPKHVAKGGVRLSAIGKLYEVYGREVDPRNAHQDHVLFAWRGETRTFRNIFVNIRSTVMDPVYVYELNDVYFKYVLANIYYETIVYVNRLCSLDMKSDQDMDKTMYIEQFHFYHDLYNLPLLSVEDFPKPFRYLVELINSYVSTFFQYVRGHNVFWRDGDYQTKVEKEFAKLGTFLNMPKTSVSSNMFSAKEETSKAKEFKSKIESIVASTNKTFIKQFVEKYI